MNFDDFKYFTLIFPHDWGKHWHHIIGQWFILKLINMMVHITRFGNHTRLSCSSSIIPGNTFEIQQWGFWCASTSTHSFGLHSCVCHDVYKVKDILVNNICSSEVYTSHSREIMYVFINRLNNYVLWHHKTHQVNGDRCTKKLYIDARQIINVDTFILEIYCSNSQKVIYTHLIHKLSLLCMLTFILLIICLVLYHGMIFLWYHSYHNYYLCIKVKWNDVFRLLAAASV